MGNHLIRNCERCGNALIGKPLMCSTHGENYFRLNTGDTTSAVTTLHRYANGATRSEVKPRFDLIPTKPLQRLADRYAMGAPKHGEHNYKKGLPYDDTLNHIVAHLQSYNDRRKKYFELKTNGGLVEAWNKLLPSGAEWNSAAGSAANYEPTLAEWMKATESDGDDLAAAAWGCFTLMYLEEEGKLL